MSREQYGYYSWKGYHMLLEKLGAQLIINEPIPIYVVGDYDPAAVEFLIDEHQILESIGRVHTIVSYILVALDSANGRYKVFEVRRSAFDRYLVYLHSVKMVGARLGNLQWECDCRMADQAKRGESELPVCRHVLLLWSIRSRSNAEAASNMLDELLREYSASVFDRGHPPQLVPVDEEVKP